MSDATPKTPKARDLAARQIIGISLPPKIAAEFKQEADRRGLQVRTLFLEMWSAYRAPDAK